MREAAKEVKVENNRGVDIFWRFLPIILCTAFIVFVLATWQQLPERIPTHFNAAGVADDWSGRNSVLTLPFMAFFLFALLQVVERMPERMNYPFAITESNKAHQHRLAIRMLRALSSVISCLFLSIYLETWRVASEAFSTSLFPLVWLFLALTLATVGIYLVVAHRSR